MKRVLWIVAALIIAAGVWYAGAYRQHIAPSSSEVTIPSIHSTSSPPALAADLYPLYAKAPWGAPTALDYQLPTRTVPGAGITAEAAASTMNPGATETPFEKFYRARLLARGWKVDTGLEAGGPMGGQTAYRKGSQLIILSFKTVFHTVSTTAPAQCPCDVTLSLFSATDTPSR